MLVVAGADKLFHLFLYVCRGEVSDYVLMEGRGFGFVTFKDPQNAQQFLEVAILDD